MSIINGWSVVLFLGGYEATNLLIQKYVRLLFYRKAQEYALSVGKPLLVVGQPKGRHGYGDVCIDLDPTDPKCEKADVQDLPFQDGQFGAAFASHVIEHVDDPDKAISELSRVADRAWIAYPHPWSFMALFHPDHRWLLLHKRESAPGASGVTLGKDDDVVGVPAFRDNPLSLGDLANQGKAFGATVLKGLGLGLGIIAAHGAVGLVTGKETD